MNEIKLKGTEIKRVLDSEGKSLSIHLQLMLAHPKWEFNDGIHTNCLKNPTFADNYHDIYSLIRAISSNKKSSLPEAIRLIAIDRPKALIVIM